MTHICIRHGVAWIRRLLAVGRPRHDRRRTAPRRGRLEIECLEDRQLPSGIQVVGLGPGGPPTVYVFNSQTHQELLQFNAYDPAFTGGVRVALADLSGNGVPDIITAPGPGGGADIRVFNSTTGALLQEFFAFDPSFSGGASVAAGDVNGDGTPDIIVGAGPGGGPAVRAFSGTDGTPLDSFLAYDPAFTGGVNVAAGDINGNGHADIVTAPGSGGGPVVRIFDGTTSAMLASYLAYDPAFTGGVSVAAANLANTGTMQVITGPGAGGGPVLRIFNGLSSTPAATFFAFAPSFTGGVQVDTDDLVPGLAANIVVGAGPGGGPAVATFDGQSLAPIATYLVGNPSFTGGLFVAGHVAGPLPAAGTGVLYVTSTADSGPGTLRTAIQNADADTSQDQLVIDFSALNGAAGPPTINLLTPLPSITRDHVIVDGTTAGGFTAAPLVELNGTAIPHPPLIVNGQYTPSSDYNSNGLLVNSSNVTVQGLVFDNFPGNGLVFIDGTGDQVFDVYSGTDATGTVAEPNILDGIYLAGKTQQDTIGGAHTLNRAATGDPNTPAVGANGRNVFSGNGIAPPVADYTPAGIEIFGPGTDANVVTNNVFGLDASATMALPNLYAGVFIHGGASNNQVDASSGTGNFIASNGTAQTAVITGGVIIDQPREAPNTFSAQNRILNNVIGLNRNLAPAGNIGNGITVFPAAMSTNIADNTIAANTGDGVLLLDAGTTATVVGNYIGTDVLLAANALNLGNGQYGVLMTAGTANNLIGGSQLLSNTASGNTSNSNLDVANFIWNNGVAQVGLGNSTGVSPAGNGNAVLDNSLFGTAPGIENGSTANAGLAAPTLTSVTSAAGSTTIAGTFQGLPSTAYQVQIFAAPASLPMSDALAQFFLTQFTVTTDAGGQGLINQVVNGLTIGPSPSWVVATITDPNNNSSPLSSPVQSSG